MKLYTGMKKRKAKQFVGGEARFDWLMKGLTIKPGDVVHICKGFNARVIDIEPEWDGRRNGWFIRDFTVVTEWGNCSWMHCIEYPAFKAQEILQHWKDSESKHCFSDWKFSEEVEWLREEIRQGRNPFDENGFLNRTKVDA